MTLRSESNKREGIMPEKLPGWIDAFVGSNS
jgi:hypothetical protein